MESIYPELAICGRKKECAMAWFPLFNQEIKWRFVKISLRCRHAQRLEMVLSVIKWTKITNFWRFSIQKDVKIALLVKELRHGWIFLFGQSGEVSRWSVCYQRGLPRLVLTVTSKNLMVPTSINSSHDHCFIISCVPTMLQEVLIWEEPGIAGLSQTPPHCILNINSINGVTTYITRQIDVEILCTAFLAAEGGKKYFFWGPICF